MCDSAYSFSRDSSEDSVCADSSDAPANASTKSKSFCLEASAKLFPKDVLNLDMLGRLYKLPMKESSRWNFFPPPTTS